MRTNKIYNSIFTGIIIFVSLLIGCAGGTSGTGGSSGGGLGVNGIIRSGITPMKGVQVSVINPVPAKSVAALRKSTVSPTVSPGSTIANDVTDDQGAFMLMLDEKTPEVSLRFRGETFNSTYTIRNIPDAAASVTVDLNLNQETDSIEESHKKYEDENGNEIHSGGEH